MRSPAHHRDLSNNGFTGPLPPEWAALGSLARLDASGNYLSGGLPDPWHALAGLRELQLASNNLGVRGAGVERRLLCWGWVVSGEL